MIVVAKPSSRILNGIAWAIFWRIALAGLLASVAIGFAIGFVTSLGYLIASGGDRGELPSTVAFVRDALIFLGSTSASFLVLKWVIRSRLGQVVHGHTLIVAAVNTDKDLSNAD